MSETMTIDERIADEAAALARLLDNNPDSPLDVLFAVTRALADTMRQHPSCACLKTHEGPRCTEREEARLPGLPRIPADWKFRRWTHYDPRNLCLTCAAFYFAKVAASRVNAARMGRLDPNGANVAFDFTREKIA